MIRDNLPEDRIQIDVIESADYQFPKQTDLNTLIKSKSSKN